MFLFLIAFLIPHSANADMTNYEKMRAEFDQSNTATMEQFYSKKWQCILWADDGDLMKGIPTNFRIRSYTYATQGPLFPEKTVSVPELSNIPHDHLFSDDRTYVEKYIFETNPENNCLLIHDQNNSYTKTMIRFSKNFLIIKVIISESIYPYESHFNYAYCF